MKTTSDIQAIIAAFLDGYRTGPTKKRAHCNRDDMQMREEISDNQLDKMLSDTFPASDPVTMY